jgi:gas vesicle protein
MKYLLSFMLGTVFGVAIALMFAPTSGTELRTNLKAQVDTQSAKVQEQWQEKFSLLQSKIDKMSGDLKALEEETKESESLV